MRQKRTSATGPANPASCSLHNTVEGGIYPYRCHRCLQCFLCAHRLLDRRFWLCADGTRIPTTFSPGVPVPPLPSFSARLCSLLRAVQS